MLNKLTRDYWPETVSSPVIRTILSILGGPILIAPVACLIVLLADLMTGSSFSAASARALGFLPEMLLVSLLFTVTLGSVGFLLLWALRKRGRWAFASTGAAIGLIGALGAPLVSGSNSDFLIVLVVIFVLYFAAIMLAVRWIAGIR